MAYLQGFIGLLDVLDLHFGSAYKKIMCEGKEGNRIKSDLDVLLLFFFFKYLFKIPYLIWDMRVSFLVFRGDIKEYRETGN